MKQLQMLAQVMVEASRSEVIITCGCWDRWGYQYPRNHDHQDEQNQNNQDENDDPAVRVVW